MSYRITQVTYKTGWRLQLTYGITISVQISCMNLVCLIWSMRIMLISVRVRESCEYFARYILVRVMIPSITSFTVHPRPRTARRDQPAFRVKSVLKGTETDRKSNESLSPQHLKKTCSFAVSRQELVGWLQSQIAEQKRVDTSSSGASSSFDSSQGLLPNKDIPGPSDVQLMLPGDAKKQRKQTKQLFLDRGI